MNRKLTFLAVVVFSTVAAVLPSWAYELDRELQREQDKGHYAQVIAKIKAALSAQPDRSDCLPLTERLADCYEAVGQFRRAADEWDDVSVKVTLAVHDIEPGIALREIHETQLPAQGHIAMCLCLVGRSAEGARRLAEFVATIRSEYSRDGEPLALLEPLARCYIIQAVCLTRLGKRVEAAAAIREATVKAEHHEQAACLQTARDLRHRKRYCAASFWYDAARLMPGSVDPATIAKEATACKRLQPKGTDVPK